MWLMAQSSSAQTVISARTDAASICEYTTAGEKGVGVNSHQNSHDAHQNARWLLVFVFFLWHYSNGGVGHVQIQLFVVLRHVFWLFYESTGKTVTYQMFLWGDGVCGGCPHENSKSKSISDHSLSFISWILVHRHWLGSGWVYFRWWLSIKNTTP